MKILILFLITLPLLISSAPKKRIEKETGPDLKILLPANHGIQLLGWKGGELLEVKKNQKELTIKRVAWGKIPNEMILIPQADNLKPDVVRIDPQNLKYKFEPSWQKISKEEVVFWGKTPRGVCSFVIPLEETHAAAIFVTFPKSKVYSDGGSFFVTMKKQKVPLYFHLSTYHGKFSSVESTGVEPATEIQKKHCDSYHGGPCDKVFQVPEKSFGFLHHIKFGPVKKNSTPCPV